MEAPQQAHENHASAGRIAGHAKRGGHEGFDHLFQGRRTIPRRLLAPIQQNQAFLVGRHRPPQNHGFEQRLFGMEMVVHGGKIYFRFGDDAAQRSSGIALLGKQPFRGIEDALLGVIHGCLNQTYDYSA